RADVKRDTERLDRVLPSAEFDPGKPATFVYMNLLRQLVLNKGDNLKKGDGIDFCHAVIGAAYASAMTLDIQWKRRIEALPQPNQLARVYAPSELRVFVEDLEQFVE